MCLKHSELSVFLTDKTNWQQITKDSNNYPDIENTKYILVYSVVRSKLIKKITDKLKKITNLKIITIDPNLVANTTYYKNSYVTRSFQFF